MYTYEISLWMFVYRSSYKNMGFLMLELSVRKTITITSINYILVRIHLQTIPQYCNTCFNPMGSLQLQTVSICRCGLVNCTRCCRAHDYILEIWYGWPWLLSRPSSVCYRCARCLGPLSGLRSDKSRMSKQISLVFLHSFFSQMGNAFS